MFALVLSVTMGAPVDAPAFVVTNKCPPAFTVTNRIPVTPPAKPAPKVRRWQDARGQWWEQEVVEPEAGAATNPFPQSRTTPRTSASSAGYLNTGRVDAAPVQGRTFTPAPTATLGFTTTVRCVGYR